MERVLARLRAIEGRVLDEDTLERIEKELELVGLGRGKGRETIEEELNRKANEPIAWKEVLLGKKGKGFEQETDNTDWEKGESFELACCLQSLPRGADFGPELAKTTRSLSRGGRSRTTSPGG